MGGAYLARSLNLNAQRCVNLFPELVDTKDGKEVAAFYGTPGLDLLVTPIVSEVRGLFATKNYMYAVIGNTLYEIDTSYTATSRGTLLTSSGPVSMDDNGLQIMIVDGAHGYIYTFATSTLTQVTDVDFPGADIVQFVDTYFIFNIPGTGQWGLTDQYDGSAVDPLDFVTSEGNPDDVTSIIADHREPWVFNENSTEIYVNTGNGDFPFETSSGRFIEQGIVSPFARAKLDNSIAWVGQDSRGCCIVWQARGYTPQRISTHAIELILSARELSNTIAFSYQQEGHDFFFLTSPDWDSSLCYDASTKLWHERTYFNSTTAEFERHRANSYCFFNGQHIVGDHSNGKIYRLNLDTYTDAGDIRKWLRSWPALPPGSSNRKRQIYSNLEIDCESGIGLSSGQGSNPQVMLRYSKDNGHTWSNERWASMGRIGEYGYRARWLKMGEARDMIFEVSGTDPVKIALLSAQVNV